MPRACLQHSGDGRSRTWHRRWMMADEPASSVEMMRRRLRFVAISPAARLGYADTGGRRGHHLDRLDPRLSGAARQRASVRFRPMSFKRRVLAALGKDVLLEIGRGLKLDVTTRMGVEELRDAL